MGRSPGLGRAGPRLLREGGAEEAGGHGCVRSRLPVAGRVVRGRRCLSTITLKGSVCEELRDSGEVLRNRQGLGSRLRLHVGVTQRN